MSDTERSRLDEQLDALGEEWSQAQQPGDEARRQNLEIRIWELAYHRYTAPDQQELMGELWEKEWKSFDPAKYKLSVFFASRLKYRRLDKLRRAQRDPLPLADMPERRSAAPGEGDPWSSLEAEDAALFMNYLALILELPERLHGRANNPTRLNYFRLFYTDDMSAFLRQAKDIAPYAAQHGMLCGR